MYGALLANQMCVGPLFEKDKEESERGSGETLPWREKAIEAGERNSGRKGMRRIQVEIKVHSFSSEQ